MKLPDPVPLDAEIARAIATRHGVPAEPFSPLETTGIINSVYALGSLVLRVPRDHPAHVDQLRREAAVVPLARAAGVRTPGVVAFDDCCDLLPVPYLLVERVPGVALGVLAGDPAAAENAWSAVGRDLARLHASPPPEVVDGWFHEIDDARELVVRRAREGWFSSVEEGWLGEWLRELARRGGEPHTSHRLVHGDVQATNVMVEPRGRHYRALIDWGCAGVGDPAVDFLGMPLRAVPAVLAGYREIARLDGDEGAEARIVWLHLRTVLDLLPRGAAPGCSWGEQPIAMLMDLVRFFAEDPGPAWRGLGPPTA